MRNKIDMLFVSATENVELINDNRINGLKLARAMMKMKILMRRRQRKRPTHKYEYPVSTNIYIFDYLF